MKLKSFLLFFSMVACFQDSARADEFNSMLIQDLTTGIGGTSSRPIDFMRNVAALQLNRDIVFNQNEANQKFLIPLSLGCSIAALPVLEADHPLVANKNHVYIVTSVKPYYSDKSKSWNAVAIQATSAIHRPLTIAVVCENINIEDSVEKLRFLIRPAADIKNYRDTF